MRGGNNNMGHDDATWIEKRGNTPVAPSPPPPLYAEEEEDKGL